MNEYESIDESTISRLTESIRDETDAKTLSCFFMNRGRALHVLGRRVESVKDYFSALDLESRQKELAHIKAMISLALLESEEKEQAMWWAVAAIESDPVSPEAHYTFGLNCAFSDFDGNAIRAFRSVLELDPNHSEAILALGKSIRENGDLFGALEVLRKYVTDHPDDPRGHFELGWTTHLNFALVDRIASATNHYLAALELKPDKRLRERIEKKLRSLTEEDS